MRNLLVLVLWGFATALQASVPSQSIDEFVDAEMPKSGTPGLAYAVVENGAIVAGARGEILIGSGQQVTPDTPFQIGSITKSFTAMAVMQLVEGGKIDLDGEISQYLDAFVSSPGSAITIRQLLSHTSGYSTLQGNTETDSDALLPHVEQVAQWVPAHQPGTVFDYSNANYQVLGALIETVSGDSYARYIEANVFKPIGLAHSFFGDGASHDNVAIGHVPWFTTKRPVKESKRQRYNEPAGGIYASANDLALYLALMMNGTDDVLSAKSKSEMMRPASDASPYYGLGWSIDPANGSAYHTGTIPGVDSFASMVPAQHKAVLVFANGGGGMGFGENVDLFNGIAAIALGQDYASDQGHWGRKGMFLSLALAPLFFVIGMITVVFNASGLRAKSGAFGAFSLWFPLLMTIALAYTAIQLIPKLFGVTLQTLYVYQPDLALILVATGITGVLWAVVRLWVYYGGSGRR